MKVRINKVTLHSLLRELHEDAPTMESTVFVRYRGGQFGLMYHAAHNAGRRRCGVFGPADNR